MIESSNLYLNKLSKEDFNFYKSIYTNEKLVQFVCPVLDFEEVIKCFKQTLKQHQKTQPQHVLYVIRLKVDDEAVGVIGLRWNQESKEAVEIGVIISQEYQRKAYGHEAKSCLIQYAFKQLNINQIVAICDVNNVAANVANSKLGFKKQASFLKERNNKSSISWSILRGTDNGK